MLAQDRGDYDEAARQYQRSLNINERLGDQAGIASTYHNLGMLAQDRGDYDEAARQYQRSLNINERLGDQAGMASTYSQLGILKAEQPDGSAAMAVAWHVKALAIRLRLRLPQAVNNLHQLAAHRGQLGPERFTSLLSQATGDTKLTDTITSLLGQLDAPETGDA
jgi:tetratricopeptide (TPR) repeat protein